MPHQVEDAQPAPTTEQQGSAAKGVASDSEKSELVIHSKLMVRPVTDLQMRSSQVCTSACVRHTFVVHN